ncbi:MAG: M28 family peptidase [Alkalibacterium sp.]|uniref:M28 family peptidase n=1 Tax=Alkalibacterium sp. TaxID=1872447 RepID=UPI003970BAE2
MHNDKLFMKLDEILNYISVEIGERLTGSENNKKVEAYAENYFKNQGFEVELQRFSCLDFKRADAELTFQGETIPVKPSYYTTGCDVTGDYVKIETVAELKRSHLTDKIAVLHGELTAEQIMPKSFPFYNPERHQEIVRLLEEKNPAAIVTVVEKDESIFEDGDFAIPSVYVSMDEGEVLLENNGELKLVIDAAREDSHGANVIARLNPEKSRKLVITAHLDTKSGTPGALDNATGIAILLLLSQLIKSEDMDFCLELLLLNGEDYYSIPGQLAYMETYLQKPENILLAINCDGVGLKKGPTAVFSTECDSKTEDLLNQIILDSTGMVFIDPWVQGDHTLFVMKHIPTVAFTSEGIFDILDTVIHTEKDTIELIDHEKVIKAVRVIEEMVKKFKLEVPL